MLIRIPSLIQILIVEFITLLLFASTGARLMAGHGALGCPGSGIAFDLTAVCFVLVGGLGAGWLGWRIFWPKIVEDSYRPTLTVGPVMIQNPLIGSVTYGFNTTHPSYALMELTLLFPMYFIYSFGDVGPDYAGCDSVFRYLFGRMAMLLVLVFPLLRLFGWYVLGRQLPLKSQFGSWQPVLAIVALVVPAYLLVPLLVYVPLWRAPLVDAQSFRGGLAQHSELTGKTVKVRARIVRKGSEPALSRCLCDAKDPRACRVAALLLDLGDGGELVARGVSSDADTLRARADSPPARAAQPIELYGVLGPLPAVSPDKKRAAEEQLDCGWAEFGPPPAAGRAYLKVEMP